MAAAYRIPVRFKRVSAAFEDIEMVRARICKSTSGSEHSGDGHGSMSMDLSEMVNSFMERNIIDYSRQNLEEEEEEEQTENYDSDDQEIKNHKLEEESITELRRLMGYTKNELEIDPFKNKLLAEIERQEDLDLADSISSPEVKRRRLMAALRERGFDAGVCKSKWEKSGKCHPGSYEYVDVNRAGIRYIIEVNLNNEFSIAHPTESYNSLLANIPFIFVGKSEDLKRAVRLLSNAMKHSMQHMNMSMPPWRRRPYLLAKWFGSYRRTKNEISQKTGPPGSSQTVKRRSVGFAPVSEHSFETFNCRNNLAMKGSASMGKLTLAFNSP